MSGGVGTPEGFVIDPDGVPLDLSGGWTPVTRGTNLIPNPSFEYDTVGSTPAGWAATGFELNAGATITCQTTSPLYGAQVMRVVTTSAATWEGAASSLSGTYHNGVEYVFSVYLRGNAGGEQVHVQFGNTSDINDSGLLTLTTSWQRYSVTWTPIADRTGVAAFIKTNSATAMTFYVDGAQIIQGSAPVTYFDGDTTGYVWTGTAGNSASKSLPGMGTLRLAGLTIPPAPKRPEWASNADTDGQALVRNPYHDNRQCTMQVRVAANSMDDAMSALGDLQGKLQEACIQGANNGPGLKCNWTPAGSSHTLALYMVYGEITDLPVTYADGWFANKPVVTVAFQCKPFLYGTEVTGPSTTLSLPLMTVEVDDVPGDIPAEARLVVSDGTASPQARRWVEWGLEQRYYNASSPAPLLIDSGSLVTSGFAGAGTVGGNAYGGSIVGATLYPEPIAICGTGNLSHVGTFRVKARIFTNYQGEYWRLTWQAADGDYSTNDYAQPVTTDTLYSEVDLGIVTIEPVKIGTQKWSGRIEAFTDANGSGAYGAVDYLLLFPVEEGYGRLEAAYSYSAGVITARDDFSLVAAGSALNGHAAVVGGTWATSGTTTDFVYYTDGDGGTWASRSAETSGHYRYAILGTATPSDVEVGVLVDAVAPKGDTMYNAVIARWTNSSNYLTLVAAFTGNALTLSLQTVVAGFYSVIAQGSAFVASSEFTLRLVAYASGRALGWLLDTNGSTLCQIDGFSTDLATGGTIATGKSGFADQSVNVSQARLYGNFYAATPAAEPLIINAGKSLEIRSDSNLRQSSDGTTYGDIPSRGSRLFVPQAGDANRATRIAVRTVREDPVTQVSRNDLDPTTLTVYYTPRYLAVPRS